MLSVDALIKWHTSDSYNVYVVVQSDRKHDYRPDSPPILPPPHMSIVYYTADRMRWHESGHAFHLIAQFNEAQMRSSPLPVWTAHSFHHQRWPFAICLKRRMPQ